MSIYLEFYSELDVNTVFLLNFLIFIFLSFVPWVQDLVFLPMQPLIQSDESCQIITTRYR
jgi:hypothetical protein